MVERLDMNQERKQIKIFQDQDYKKLGILYGLFFEDLNHAADGGLYAEMVQNRSFEYCEMDRQEQLNGRCARSGRCMQRSRIISM